MSSDARALFRQSKLAAAASSSSAARVTHPHAAYDSATGTKLRCTVCALQIKSPAAWTVHVASRAHKLAVEAERKRAAGAGGGGAVKRKRSEVDEEEGTAKPVVVAAKKKTLVAYAESSSDEEEEAAAAPAPPAQPAPAAPVPDAADEDEDDAQDLPSGFFDTSAATAGVPALDDLLLDDDTNDEEPEPAAAAPALASPNHAAAASPKPASSALPTGFFQADADAVVAAQLSEFEAAIADDLDDADTAEPDALFRSIQMERDAEEQAAQAALADRIKRIKAGVGEPMDEDSSDDEEDEDAVVKPTSVAVAVPKLVVEGSDGDESVDEDELYGWRARRIA
ncbi:hypothetical protein H9P43_003989 [Blastocladiella emersonii ATCC 22665]|nr:hypothetical protein H9P43_003989 [Blastocladiella emersonii ATCC 22665]